MCSISFGRQTVTEIIIMKRIVLSAYLCLGAVLFSGCSGQQVIQNQSTAPPSEARPEQQADIQSAPVPADMLPTEQLSPAPVIVSATPTPKPTFADIAYASVSPAEKLDIWLPRESTSALRPLIIIIHGGGFLEGDKSGELAQVSTLLDQGYAVASINYRLSDEAIFPASMRDAKAAVRFLRAQASTYGFDPNRFAAWGGSAGGYLAVMLGVTGGQKTVFDDPSLGNAGTPSDVQAVIDWFGLVNLLSLDSDARSGKCPNPSHHDDPGSPESQLLGAPLQDARPKAQQANLLNYIRTAKVMPPFHIAHGDMDCSVALKQSVTLDDALLRSGFVSMLTILPGARHADPRFDTEEIGPSVEFLNSALKP